MSKSTLVAVRVPSAILETLDKAVKDRLATDRKSNRSQIILDALEAYLSQTALDTDSVRVASNSDESLTELILAAIEPMKLEMEVLRGKLPA